MIHSGLDLRSKSTAFQGLWICEWRAAYNQSIFFYFFEIKFDNIDADLEELEEDNGDEDADEGNEDADEDSEEELGQPVKRRKPNNEKKDKKI